MQKGETALGSIERCSGSMNLHRLCNTSHTEITPFLPLLHLPLSFGANSQELRLVEDGDGTSQSFTGMSKAVKIAQLLKGTDVSYLCLKNHMTYKKALTSNDPESLIAAVLHNDPNAFNSRSPDASKRRSFQHSSDKISQQIEYRENPSTISHKGSVANPEEMSMDIRAPLSGMKSKIRRKDNIDGRIYSGKTMSGVTEPEKDVHVGKLTEILNALFENIEVTGGEDGEGSLHIAFSTIKLIAEELMAADSKKLLNLVPVGHIVKLLDVLNHHIREACDKTHGDYDDVEAESYLSIMSALEAVQLTLTIMTHPNMPKQVYKEEIIETVVDFSRHQIVHSVFTAYDASYWMIHKGGRVEADDGIEDENAEVQSRSVKKGRSRSKGWKVRKAASSKVSTAVSNLLYKLCTILGLFKDLLSVERLPDSYVLQLIKTSIATFAVENIQLLQLKAIGVICVVFSSYSEHRTIIMDEIIHLLWKLPTSKRTLRPYHLPDEEQKQIQVIAALLMQLVQCCVTLPKTSKESSAVNGAHDTTAGDCCPSKFFEPAVETCKYFWGNVLQYLTVSKSQENTDVKIIIENLVVDLLTTLNVPEYPAGSLLLQILCALLIGNAGLKSKEVAVRGVAIDLLGQIAARLKHDSVACSNCRHWMLQELQEQESEDVPHNEVCVVCSGERTAKFMVICEGCQRWFHGDCIGVTGHDLISRSWVCYCCLCKRQLTLLYSQISMEVEKVRKDGPGYTSNELSIPVRGIDVIQQILLNYLQGLGYSDSATFAYQFYLCQWYKDDPNALRMLPFYHVRLNSKLHSMDFGIAASVLSRDVAKCITAALGQQRALARGFDKLLDRLLASLQENSPVLRAKALRAVSAIVEADPGVLGDSNVRCAVEGRFHDSAISVREAAMELVGHHIVSRPDVAAKYFNTVAERIMDKGVSVRKRVIKIIRDICFLQSDFVKSSDACYRLISRINDEETSIQDLVCKTFFELWFEEPSSSQTEILGDGSIVPLEIAERTQQLVNVLSMLNNHQPLVTIIRRTMALDFCSKSIGTSAVSQAAVRNRCELMCKCLVESILKAEETSSVESEIRALPYVLALHAFCTVDPTICAPASDPSRFVVTLQPYLKTQADNRAIAQLLQSIVFVIDAVLPFIRRPPPNFVEELERDLRQLILRYSFLSVVEACIKCLCSLSRVATKGVSSFEFLLRKFFKYLDTGCKVGYRTTDQLHALRCLYCLGLLVRYGAELIKCLDKQDLNAVRILSLCKQYLHIDDVVVKARSLQALGFVCIAIPEFMMENETRNILKESLAANSDTRIKVQILRTFYDYLVDVEEQMGKDDVDNNTQNRKANGAVPVAAGEGDNNICGGIIQLHWQSILEKCMDMNDQVRQSALKVVEVALRQGLVHPVTCVPYLIASEVDEQESNANIAHSLSIYMNEKYPSFFESRIGDGIELSFKFIESCASSSLHDEAIESNKFGGCMAPRAKLGMSRIYNLIRGSRISRNKFMSSIVHKFDQGSLENSSLEFLVYCTEVLASLPFVSPDEPLYLVQTINRTIQPRAGNLESRLKKFIFEGPLQKVVKTALEAEVDKCGRSVIHSTKSAKSKTNGAQKLLHDIQGINEDFLEKLKEDCHAAIAFSLLLMLKSHMKIVYGLSDARCQAFSSNEHIKQGDVLVKQNISFSIEAIPVASPTTVHQVLEKYQVLKRSLEEDSFDYASPTSVSRKRTRSVALQANHSTENVQPKGHIPAKRLRRKNLFSSCKDETDESSDDEYQQSHKKKRLDNSRLPRATR